MIKAVIFDCFGVLTTDTWKEFVQTLPEAQREPASALNHAYDRGCISKSEFFHELQALTDTELKDIQKVFGAADFKNTQLLDYIGSLRSHYKIGLLSNVASDWITEELLNNDEQKLFDEIVLSYKVGATKPQRKMFEIMIDQLGLEMEECVFIDDVDRYCAAAKEYGMQAVIYSNFAQMRAELEMILAADSKD